MREEHFVQVQTKGHGGRISSFLHLTTFLQSGFSVSQTTDRCDCSGGRGSFRKHLIAHLIYKCPPSEAFEGSEDKFRNVSLNALHPYKLLTLKFETSFFLSLQRLKNVLSEKI